LGEPTNNVVENETPRSVEMPPRKLTNPLTPLKGRKFVDPTKLKGKVF